MDWDTIETKTLRLARHVPLRIPKHPGGCPSKAGFYRSVGLNRAAHVHFRRRIEGRRSGLHVLEFGDHYLVHWDRIDPSVSIILHFLDDVTWAACRAIRRIYARVAGRPTVVVAQTVHT